VVLYIKSVKNGELIHTSHEGMEQSIIAALLEDMGHTNIEVVSKEEFDGVKRP